MEHRFRDTCHDGLEPAPEPLQPRQIPGPGRGSGHVLRETGAFFDNGAALSCSNVSCHGGQATPNWQTGAINVNDQCSNCHAQGRQYQ
jgi:predicted CxxxxCH...CXXCH cytochrome family protein